MSIPYYTERIQPDGYQWLPLEQVRFGEVIWFLGQAMFFEGLRHRIYSQALPRPLAVVAPVSKSYDRLWFWCESYAQLILVKEHPQERSA